ncbi:MAG: DUF2333 family protein [Gammaproteobacteria bacterium]|nr:MAG: DUF2333 family protein [Gammaproteobacteria bacterium]
MKLLSQMSRIGQGLVRLYHPETWRSRGWVWASGVVVFTLLVGVFVLSLLWGAEPSRFDVVDQARARAGLGDDQPSLVTGYVMGATLARVAETLLDKPGGYLTNDKLPPGLVMDNIPNWEFGVLVQVRDLARALRNDMSRSQSQSIENEALSVAEPLFNFDSDSWVLPASESQYRQGILAVDEYLRQLSGVQQGDAQFFARADNLREWLVVVEKRLGSLSQRLSASVGQIRINTDLAGDAGAREAAPGAKEIEVKTPWMEIDDVFYEARGAVWAMIHFLQAAEIDFADVLKKKNALVSLRQIIRELQSTQHTVWSPMVLNGRGFGLVTNYSLIMATYISRANAAVIDLNNLLVQG